MKKYKQVYFDALGYSEGDFVPSEISGQPAVDIHHIEARGSGGSKKEERIENLMAVTRDEHIRYGDRKDYMRRLLITHFNFLEKNGVKFNKQYLINKIEKYETI